MKKTLSIVGVVAAAMLSAVWGAHAAEYDRLGNSEAPNVPQVLQVPQVPKVPINFVAVTERIHTSGQPSQAQLGELKSKGYAFIINLATPASSGSIAEEGMLIAKTGISYLNIPVDFKSPVYEDFELFSNILRQSGSRRVLVHCQVNKRASVFTFLYRVVHEGIAPDRAWESVTSIWAPDPQWTDFIRMVLKRHNIVYDPF
jgi:protein tyrosine phosphatase (PTP) superfamily phosphohydrolase (DUF442 family)